MGPEGELLVKNKNFLVNQTWWKILDKYIIPYFTSILIEIFWLKIKSKRLTKYIQKCWLLNFLTVLNNICDSMVCNTFQEIISYEENALIFVKIFVFSSSFVVNGTVFLLSDELGTTQRSRMNEITCTNHCLDGFNSETICRTFCIRSTSFCGWHYRKVGSLKAWKYPSCNLFLDFKVQC